ncbi:MAG: four-helix bundle copper-binding protein [Nannocystis sp.]|nr:four-helix bundle copper-binding protein [Nannocystis sp.]
MLRRNFIAGNTALVTACASDDIAPPSVKVRPVEPKKRPPPAKPAPTAAEASEHEGHPTPAHPVLEASSACARAGQLCLAHCLVVLGQGDTTIAECAQAVSDMLAVHQAVAALAAAGSRHLKAQLAVADEVTERCKAACDTHADKHPTCRDCAKACGDALLTFARHTG